MSDETLYDLRCYVSDCFNANHGCVNASTGTTLISAYQHLSQLMIDEYDLDNNDVDEVASNIEDMVSKYIMENSTKFTEDEEH